MYYEGADGKRIYTLKVSYTYESELFVESTAICNHIKS
jgi:hypothetical protein